MFLAINQNVLAAKKRKKEKQQQQQQQQQQQMLNQQQQEWQQEQNLILATGETGEMKTIAEPTANTIDKMLMEFTTESTAATTTTTKCKNCQHELRSGQQQQQQQLENKRKQPQQQLQVPATATSHFSHGTPATDFLNSEFHADRNFSPPPPPLPLLPVECHCNCNCVHKSFGNGSSGSSAKNCHHMLPSTTKVPSLHTVYMCLGALTFALATLAILFYSHVNSVASSSLPSSSDVEVVPFREQFRRELHASDDMLRSIVAQILQQQRQLQHEPPQQSPSSAVSVSMSDVAYETTKQQNQIPVAVSQDDDDNDVDVGGSSSSSSSTGGISYAPLENFRYQSTTLPYDNTEIVRNERKFSRRSISSSSDVAGSGKVDQNYNEVQQRKRRDISSPSSTLDESFIEFLNPNHREVRKRDGQKGSAVAPDDQWFYLDTKSRVPENLITDFCKKTKEYCPPGPQGPQGPMGPKGLTGPPGLPGIPGPKGNRGDVGLPGAPGVDGNQGIMGPRGPKGDIGIPGRVGLDGRDGVPGEPGLDGVPGRAGADGIPGKDGEKGRDGRHGEDGKNGKDGAPGLKGAQGPPGDRGLKGIAGIRGRTGKSGTNGTPGIPGINAWKVQLVNGSFSNELLIPPSIADANAPHIQRTVIVEEGKTLNISCGATGNPEPRVEWRRDDGHTINSNGVEMSSVSGQYLKFRNITRHQMAAYTCYAANGVSPVANATYLVEVQFAPMISIYRDMIYAEYGHSASLDCYVEAYPEAIRYWERSYDGKILDPGEKYRIESNPDGFKTKMRLTINNLRKDDFGYYHCVARNELNATMANFEIAPQDPNSEIPSVGNDVKIFGQRPPEKECPVCEHCQETSPFHCKDSINSNFDIQPIGNNSYPGLPKRRHSCLLYAIGKPVYHKLINESYASWLKDAAAKEFNREKTFLTKENDYKNLYEFQNKVEYRLNKEGSRRHEVSEGFYGNAHVVFNGSFFFHQRNTDLVVKKDLTTFKEITMQLPFSGVISGNKLYATDYNYMDFNVDDVGLWVIYSTYDSNNTMVAKLDADNLKMQYNYNITLDHRKFGEMFIVCGHLYAIDSCTDKNSQIRYVVDLYNGKLLNVDLPYSNPFRKTTTVSYNPLNVELYSLDKGNALTYPIRYHEQALDVPGNKEK